MPRFLKFLLGWSGYMHPLDWYITNKKIISWPLLQKILTDDAKDEYCELSRNIEIPNDLYPQICKILPIDKINVSLLNIEENKSFKFSPSNTITGLYYWIPIKRRKK